MRKSLLSIAVALAAAAPAAHGQVPSGAAAVKASEPGRVTVADAVQVAATVQAIDKARPVILEPIVKIRILAQNSAMGDLAGDLSGRRGRVLGSDSTSLGQIAINGEVPLAELEGYESRLKSITGGEGTYSIELSHYEAVPATVQKQLQDAFHRSEGE